MGLVASYLSLMTEKGPQRDHDVREVFNGLRWIVRTGAQWRMIPIAEGLLQDFGDVCLCMLKAVLLGREERAEPTLCVHQDPLNTYVVMKYSDRSDKHSKKPRCFKPNLLRRLSRH